MKIEGKEMDQVSLKTLSAEMGYVRGVFSAPKPCNKTALVAEFGVNSWSALPGSLVTDFSTLRQCCRTMLH